MSDRAAIDRLRALCLSLPEAGERLSHGSPTWFAGKGKVFAMLADHHHGDAHLAVWLPMPPGFQATLMEEHPGWVFKPPYVGWRGWIGVVLDTDPDWAQVEEWVRGAYLHVAGKKLRQQLLDTET
ncbi:MAG: MmcQ/YjbR family DNA-binding protein [Alphaproteobacteria bacterium]|nr:MmcQ/YjbR family DNA-binding protein [Alphaproteobacteria bacterium]